MSRGAGTGREEYNALQRRRLYLRQTGRPGLVRGQECDVLRRRLRAFHARGMSYAQMSRASGVSPNTISDLLGRGDGAVHRRVLAPLVQMAFEAPEPHVLVDPTGARRRMSGLWGDGFPLPWLAGRLEFGDRFYFRQLITGIRAVSGVRYSTAQEISRLYAELEGRLPEEFGIPVRSSRYASTFAWKRGIPPRSCWDPDTIDDPDAQPEWTGSCGSWLGVHIHKRDGIPLCGRCEAVDGDEPYPGFDGELLRLLRLRKGYSRARLADLVDGVNASTLQYWEVGRNRPARQHKLDRVLSVLDATLEDVCRKEDA